MGKIFDALEKFTKETGSPKSDKIRNSDYEVLMQFDASTGKIDMADPEVLKDARGVKRLMTYRLINDDGTLHDVQDIRDSTGTKPQARVMHSTGHSPRR